MSGKKKTEEKQKRVKSNLVKVKFLKSPAGLLNLSYSIGEEVEVDKTQADLLIESSFAEKV